MAGLIDVGNSMKSNALAGMHRLSELEQSRERTKEALDRQDEADRKSNQMGMAALGGIGMAAYGAKIGLVGGPAGAVIGAAAGYLLGSLF